MHLVLEQAPETAPVSPPPAIRPLQLVILSAARPEALRAQISLLHEFLHRNPAVDLPECAYNLAVHRSRFAHRWAALVRDRSELLATLA